MFKIGSIVYTPQGRGEVVYRLPDGNLLVKFHYGGGNLYRPGQLFSARPQPAASTNKRVDEQWSHAA